MSESVVPRATRCIPEEDVRERIEKSSEFGHTDRALIVVGVTGVGKSSFLNFILNQTDRFKSAPGLKSVTRASEAGNVNFKDRKYTMVDTPGLLDSGTVDVASGNAYAQAMDQCDVFMRHLEQALHQGGRVAHAVLLLFNVQRRFSIESSWMVDALERLRIGFSHVIVVFTHGGHLGKSDEERYERFRKELQNPRSVHCGLTSVLDKVDNRFLIVESVNIDELTRPDYYQTVLRRLAKEVDKVADKPIVNERWALIKEQWEGRKKFEHEMWKTKKEIEQEVEEVERLQKIQKETSELEGDCDKFVRVIEEKRNEINHHKDDLPYFEINFSNLESTCQTVTRANSDMKKTCVDKKALASAQEKDKEELGSVLERYREEEDEWRVLGSQEYRDQQLQRLASLTASVLSTWPDLTT